MSVSTLRIYEQLTDAADDKIRSRIMAGTIEGRNPQLKEITTQPQMRKTELLLQKEIKEAEACLSKDPQAGFKNSGEHQHNCRTRPRRLGGRVV